MNNKKTLLIGSFGAQNIGDELILHSALKKYPNSVVMTADPKKSQEFLEQIFQTTPPFPTGIRSFFLFLKKTKKIFSSLNKNIDQIVFPGGGLFSLSLKAIWIWALHIYWCKQFFPGKKIKMESQGIDVSKKIIGKTLLKWSLKNIDQISVRDAQSQKNILKLTQKKVPIIGDSVENMLKEQKIPGENSPESKKIQKTLINAAKSFNYKSLIKKIDQKNINFIVFSQEDRKKVPKNFPGKIFFPNTISDLWNIFSDHSLFIGQRFHFLITALHFGTSQNVFLLEKPYAPKTKAYQKTNNLKEVLIDFSAKKISDF